jgi:hypothetical protein
MLLLAALVLVSWLCSRKLLHDIVPSESLLVFGLVGISVVVLFQLGELG